MPTRASRVPCYEAQGSSSVRCAFLLGVTMLALSACPSTGVYRTADPVPVEEWRLGGALGIGLLKDREQKTKFPTVPVVLSARRGIVEDLDIGARIYATGVQLNATWRVYHERWSLALAPSIGGTRSPDSPVVVESAHLFVQLQGIASTALDKRWTIATGPKTGWGLYYPVTGGSAQGLWLGAFVLAEAKLGSKWRVGPELGAFAVVSGEVPVAGSHIEFAVNTKRDF
jgi:hypothetical protein